MGLLDWKDDDMVMFPDYESSSQPSGHGFTSVHASAQKPRRHTTGADTTSSSISSRSSSSSSSTSSIDSTSGSPPTAKSHKPKRKRRQPSFDLFGDDSELQSAEARIDFCIICLKHCSVH